MFQTLIDQDPAEFILLKIDFHQIVQEECLFWPLFLEIILTWQKFCFYKEKDRWAGYISVSFFSCTTLVSLIACVCSVFSGAVLEFLFCGWITYLAPWGTYLARVCEKVTVQCRYVQNTSETWRSVPSPFFTQKDLIHRQSRCRFPGV